MPRDGLHVARILRRVRKRGAQLGHGFIQAAIKVNKSVGWPEFFAEFFAGNYFTGMFQQ